MKPDGSYLSKVAAAAYLCKVNKNFRTKRLGPGVHVVESYGMTGWCSQGSYNEWSRYLYIDQVKSYCEKESPAIKPNLQDGYVR